MNFLILLVIILLLGLLYLRASLVLITVQGDSMTPTLQPGDRVVVWRHYLPRWLRIGQIVLIRSQQLPSAETSLGDISIKPPFIKRVVGLPGDTVVTNLAAPLSMLNQNYLQINDKREAVWQVPNNHFFIQSDNYGLDSTVLGPLPLSDFLGVALIKLPAKPVQEVDAGNSKVNVEM